MLSLDSVKRLMHALADQSDGLEVANAINQGLASAQQDAFKLPAAIVAAHTSTTTDFAALAVGDLVVHIPAVAGNSIFYTVVTAGTLPASAVVGDLYVVVRAFASPAASSAKL